MREHLSRSVKARKQICVVVQSSGLSKDELSGVRLVISAAVQKLTSWDLNALDEMSADIQDHLMQLVVLARTPS